MQLNYSRVAPKLAIYPEVRSSSSSTAAAENTEFMHLTKPQVEDIIKYLDIAEESMDYVIRTGGCG